MPHLLTYSDVDVSTEDLETLSNGNWLNGSIIHFCLRRVVEETLTKLGEQHTANILLLDPLVVQSLQFHVDCDEERKGMARYLKLSSRTWILTIINDSSSLETTGSHWSLLALHLASGSGFHLDSMGGRNDRAAKRILELLQNLHTFGKDEEESKDGDRRGGSSKAAAAVLLPPLMIEITAPQQTEGFNCGVYSLLFADILSSYIAGGGDLLSRAGKSEIESLLAAAVSLECATAYRLQVAADIQSLCAGSEGAGV